MTPNLLPLFSCHFIWETKQPIENKILHSPSSVIIWHPDFSSWDFSWHNEYAYLFFYLPPPPTHTSPSSTDPECLWGKTGVFSVLLVHYLSHKYDVWYWQGFYIIFIESLNQLRNISNSFHGSKELMYLRKNTIYVLCGPAKGKYFLADTICWETYEQYEHIHCILMIHC